MLGSTSCGRRSSAWSSYEEVQTDARMSDAGKVNALPMSSHASDALHWTAPEGWRETAGSGMRLVTFSLDRGGQTGLCTLVRLGGAAGGLEANVRRWLGQIQVPEPPASAWKDFLDRQERVRSAGGFDGVITDLTVLGPQEPDVPSMLAGLFMLEHETLFVKLTGPLALLRAEREAFASLCLSLRGSP